MKRRSFICGIMLAALGAAAATGVGEDFSRYSLILDRQPFGTPPSPEALAAEATVAPQDSFATHVRLTALMQEEGGGRVRVGFVDKKQKDKSYMLNVGEKADDYEVLEADVASEVAKIRKGTEEQWLSMKAAGAQPPPDRRPVRPSGVIRPPSGAVQVPAAVLGGLGATNAAARRGTRYAALRRAELEREKMAEEARKLGAFREPPEDDEEDDEDVVIPVTLPPEVEEDEDDDDGDEVVIDVQAGEDEEEDEEDEDQAIREAEIQQHLQSYQKELIKQGLPPLPIPLTAKTDAELVQEGVLPPITADDDDDDDEE